MFSAKAIAANIVNIAVAALLVAACGSTVSADEATVEAVEEWASSDSYDVIDSAVEEIATAAGGYGDQVEICIELADIASGDDFQEALEEVPDELLRRSLQSYADSLAVAGMSCILGDAVEANAAIDRAVQSFEIYELRVLEIAAMAAAK